MYFESAIIALLLALTIIAVSLTGTVETGSQKKNNTFPPIIDQLQRKDIILLNEEIALTTAKKRIHQPITEMQNANNNAMDDKSMSNVISIVDRNDKKKMPSFLDRSERLLYQQRQLNREYVSTDDHDNCASQIQPQSLPYSGFGNIINATADNGVLAGCALDKAAKGIWFLVEGTDANITVSTCSQIDTVLEIYTGPSFCNFNTCVTSNDDSFTGDGFSCSLGQSEVTWFSEIGMRYHIFLYLKREYDASTDFYDIMVKSGPTPPAPSTPAPVIPPISGPTPLQPIIGFPTPTPPPLQPVSLSPDFFPTTSSPTFSPISGPINDDCTRALAIPVSTTTTVTGSTASANLSLDQIIIPPCAGILSFPGVWYIIPGNGQQIRADTCGDGTNFDTVINIFSSTGTSPENGCNNGLACFATNDNNIACSTNSRSSVSWMSNVGTTYYIFVHGFDDTGDFELTVDASESVPVPQPSMPSPPPFMPSAPTTGLAPNPPVTVVPPSGGGGGGGGGGFCFSKTNLVDVQGEGIVTMDQLRIGDLVKSFSIRKHGYYSRVVSFSHKNDSTEAEYLQIHTDSRHFDNARHPLEISHDHMVKKFDGSIIRAKDIGVGDILLDDDNDELIVTKINVINRYGLYAPVTESGMIVVSGATTSCYVALLKSIPAPLQHYVAHALYAPIRITFAVNNKIIRLFDVNNVEEYTYDGLSKNYVITAVKLAERFELQQAHPIFLRIVMATLVVPMVVIVLACERFLAIVVTLLSSMFYVVASLFFLILGWYLYNKNRNINTAYLNQKKVD